MVDETKVEVRKVGEMVEGWRNTVLSQVLPNAPHSGPVQ